VQERLESSAAGRAAISLFIVVTVVSVVVWNLPASEVKQDALAVVRPYVLATGLEQNWGVFSPDPRRQTLDLLARVRYADGGEETFRVPRGDRFVGAYWDYRWWKWVEWATSDAQKQLWEPTAAWFARRARDDGRRPVAVTLVRRWQELLPPGDGPSRSGWQEHAYYTYRVSAEEADAG
jgi:hypothetical protein